MAGLSVARVKAETRVGFHADATRGLYLQVAAGGTKSWVYRYQLNGKRRLMGLGPCTAITLQEARDAAHQARRLVLAGTDPIDARHAARSAAAVDEAKLTTFADCFDLYLKAKEPGWKGTANSAQWRASMATYALPLIGKLPVASVDTALVMKVVEPIWLEKRVTADRVRRRIEAVIDYAVAREYRPAGDNPARWKGHLANLLTSDTKPVEHLAALPYAQIPEFMAVVRDYANARPSVNDPRSREEIRMAARALEFLVLTATRSDQVLGAKWGEFDLAKRVWTVPAERMKGRKGKAREHLVPLSDAALAVLGEPGALDEFVFPSASNGKMYRHVPQPASAHGV